VRVVESRGGTGLTLEALAALRIGGELRRKDFDGDGAIETGVPGAVHLTLPPGPEDGEHLVATETGARGERH
jgi:hypothetical protein